MTKKRKLFEELMEGIDALQQQREGKITLRSLEVEDLPPLEVNADLIRDPKLSSCSPQPVILLVPKLSLGTSIEKLCFSNYADASPKYKEIMIYGLLGKSCAIRHPQIQSTVV